MYRFSGRILKNKAVSFVGIWINRRSHKFHYRLLENTMHKEIAAVTSPGTRGDTRHRSLTPFRPLYHVELLWALSMYIWRTCAMSRMTFNSMESVCRSTSDLWTQRKYHSSYEMWRANDWIKHYGYHETGTPFLRLEMNVMKCLRFIWYLVHFFSQSSLQSFYNDLSSFNAISKDVHLIILSRYPLTFSSVIKTMLLRHLSVAHVLSE